MFLTANNPLWSLPWVSYPKKYQIEAFKGNIYTFEGFFVSARGKAKTVVIL